MKEYFKCKHCYSTVKKSQIARHHTFAHSAVSHEVFLDSFFDLGRPLFKCDCCSLKLDVQRLMKHRLRAHPNKDNTFQKYTLPLLRHMDATRLKDVVPRAIEKHVIVLSSDSDTELEEGELPKDVARSFVDTAIQCGDDEMKGARADDIGVGQEPTSTSNIAGLIKSTHEQEQQQQCDKSTEESGSTESGSIDVATQVSIQTIQHSYAIPRKLPRIELDEDGCAELVFFL